MKTRLIQSLLAASALVLLGGCDTEQAATTCRAAGGGLPFATKYMPTGGAAAPAGTVCDSPGQLLALSSYDPPDAARPSLAIAVYDADFDTYPTDGSAPAIALGEFTEKQANVATSTCTAPTLSPLKSGTITYTFSNVEVYVSAANQGTQLKADLNIQDTDPAASCNTSYKVLGLWPEVHCESNADCGEGSGINPDLFESVACDASIGFCMLTGTDFVKTGGDK